MFDSIVNIDELGLFAKLLLLSGLAVGAHIVVLLIRRLSKFSMSHKSSSQRRKLLSIISLFTSSSVFIIYFAVIGFVLAEFGVPITNYFASATIIGLAVGFGSQGLVQDVVSGLTTIFSDLFDVGDMIEIGGQTGVVRHIGLRFVEIENSLGAKVVIPNRSITNVINYRRGYVRCIVDVTLPDDEALRAETRKLIGNISTGVHQQFPGIFVTAPSIEGEQSTAGGRSYCRIKFRIWPGRGSPIEQSFKQEIVQVIKKIDPDYADWMVSVYYEVENKR